MDSVWVFESEWPFRSGRNTWDCGKDQKHHWCISGHPQELLWNVSSYQESHRTRFVCKWKSPEYTLRPWGQCSAWCRTKKTIRMWMYSSCWYWQVYWPGGMVPPLQARMSTMLCKKIVKKGPIPAAHPGKPDPSSFGAHCSGFCFFRTPKVHDLKIR